jgi:SsrA-binding protein
LLLHAHEIERLGARIATERVTLIPLSIYFTEGRAKVLLGVARGRQKADKRQAIAERDAKAEAARAIGRQRKGRD